MTLSASQKRIQEYRVSFARLSGAEAFRKAAELVEQLGALQPLLLEEHRRELHERFRTAVPTSVSTPPADRKKQPRKTAAPTAVAEGMVLCPECKIQIRPDRLAKHVRKVHKVATADATKLKVQRKQNLAAARDKARSKIVCGDCDRTMTREDYKVHVCRVRSFGRLVQGGAPGLRR